MAAITKINKQELDKARNRNKEETHYKMQAMTKLETLRNTTRTNSRVIELPLFEVVNPFREGGVPAERADLPAL